MSCLIRSSLGSVRVGIRRHMNFSMMAQTFYLFAPELSVLMLQHPVLHINSTSLDSCTLQILFNDIAGSVVSSAASVWQDIALRLWQGTPMETYFCTEPVAWNRLYSLVQCMLETLSTSLSPTKALLIGELFVVAASVADTDTSEA